MIVKNIIHEDVSNYKKTAMFIGFPKCSFKCEKECGLKMCQNSSLVQSPDIDVSVYDLLTRYLENHITSAIVCGGLEPFDSWNDLKDLVFTFRSFTQDDIVIYTGYNEDELKQELIWLRTFDNIIIKFGRFVPNQEHVFDPVLGVTLASPNQYGKKIS